ncbi:hypothetical protein D9613_005330 [Agrocybe pediades]|uniref:Uncharacterized protein n=1 Tax=Agrocybe pediades TaxID=84607 RepID=A0A8H4R086_9AGAR|nr:hypothetical protein D9613_005330 [Agrocybe pediades]
MQFMLPSSPQVARTASSNQVIRRPYANIPSTPSHEPLNQEQAPPPPRFFNSRGEYINDPSMVYSYEHNNPPRLCQRCSLVVPSNYIREFCPTCRRELAHLARQTSRRPPFPASTSYDDSTALNADAKEHAMSVLSGNIPVPTFTSSTVYDKESPSVSSKDKDDNNADLNGAPRKRQKIADSRVIDLTDSQPHPSASPVREDPPNDKKLVSAKPVKNFSRSLKLCSTAHCTGTVPINSSATRCLGCVKDTWKTRRSNISTSANSRESTGNKAQEIIYIRLPGKTQKKGVTWADESESSQSQSMLVSASPEPSSQHHLEDSRRPEDNKDDQGDCSAPMEHDSQKQSTDRNEVSDSGQGASVSGGGNEVRDENPPPLKKLRALPPRPILRKEIAAVQDASEKESSVDTVDVDTSPDPSRDVLGWDSDLTDISLVSADSEGTDSGSSESESEEDKPLSSSSGLKIRIPARPTLSANLRRCASSRCGLPLAASYRWKSCVVCRARSREYQRKRQNLQGRHVRLDQELLEAQGIGTPLSKELLTGKAKLQGDVSLLPDARLCSNRNCTFIIPPVSDYHWKTCSLCRIRAREQRNEERSAAMLSAQALKNSRRRTRKKKSTDATFLLRSLDYLSRKAPMPGRCWSVDCGMAVAEGSDCSQCKARRLWLMSGNVSNETPGKRPFLPMRRGVKTPGGPPSYQEYKCFTAFLQEFKNRLSGFIEAQSLFHLFRPTNTGKALFSIDGEFSVVVNDFDIAKRREEVNNGITKFQQEIEYVGRLKFNPKKSISSLDSGGIAAHFSCLYRAPVLQVVEKDGKHSVKACGKVMQCELEIAVLPDHSHRLIPGQRTIIRFRLFG